jgi:hypothetical protein
MLCSSVSTTSKMYVLRLEILRGLIDPERCEDRERATPRGSCETVACVLTFEIVSSLLFCCPLNLMSQPEAALKGCVNDTYIIKEIIMSKGFREENIVVRSAFRPCSSQSGQSKCQLVCPGPFERRHTTY